VKFENEIPLMLEREAGAPESVNQIAVGFGLLPEEDKTASEREGHPVFTEVVFFRAVIPGDRQSNFCQPATEQHKQRFPRAWAVFQARKENPIQGLPIDQWPPISRAMAMTLYTMNIQTVEMLAEVNDNHIGSLGQQGRELREKAKAYLALAKDSAATHAYAAENKALKDNQAEMQRQIADLASKLERALAEPQKRGPGRPPKEQEAA